MKLKISSFANQKISRKFAFTVTLTVVIILTLFLCYEINTSVRKGQEDLLMKVGTLSDITRNALSQALWNFDSPAFQTIADSLLKDPEIAGIQIFGLESKPLYTNTKVGYAYLPKDLIERRVAIMNGGSVIGRVDIQFTRYLMQDKINDEISKRLFQIVAIALILISIISWTASRITAPIKLLSHEAEQIASGDLTRRIQVDTQDEVGILATKFNDMVIALSKAYDAIEQDAIELEKKNREILVYSEKLEGLVAARTADYNRANRDLKQKNQELEKNLKLISETQRQLVETEKMAALGSLVAGVAHEINTPLGNSITTLSFLEKVNDEGQCTFKNGDAPKKELLQYMEDIDEAVAILGVNLHRAAELVRSFKRLSVDLTSDIQTEFHLWENIEAVIISLKHEWLKHGHQLYNRCPKEIVMNSFPGECSQILTNLIVNSLEHGFKDRRGGTIEISATTNGDRLTLIYADNGVGIHQEHFHRIFDPFFTTNRHAGNSGLGLNIVYNIVTQKLKGSIHCESSYGSGVRFILDVPLNHNRI